MTANLVHAILAASSEGIALLDAEARFTEVNLAFARLFACEPGAIVGKTFLGLLHPPDKNEPIAEKSHQHAISRLLRALQQHENLPDTELELFIQGHPRSLNVSVTPITAPDELVILLLARDVSVAREATQMKVNILSLIAHELRAPLNTINGYLDLALTGVGGELNEQQHEFVQRARASSEHLYAMLENLLLISRADAGQLRLHQQVISLRQVVEQAVEELELLASDHNIAVEVAIPPAFPYLYADAVRLQQVLRNLLSNALRFTPIGGRVRISAWTKQVEPSEQPEPSPSATGTEPTLQAFLQVQDSGCGIPPEYHQRIFERFFQVSDTNGRAGGQGLGLAIVKMVVELHGGTVSVENAPDQGSTFTCRLPCVVS